MSESRIKIPAELFALAESSHYDGTLVLTQLDAGPDTYTFEDPVEWSVDVTNTGSALLVVGEARATGVCACARCLDDVTHDFEAEIQGFFLIDGEAGDFSDEEDDIGEDEFEVLPDDHVIDLEPLVVAGLLVDAPDQPLCKQDCMGLCPKCGSNLNEGPCGCMPEEPDRDFERARNPFSALADYKFD